MTQSSSRISTWSFSRLEVFEACPYRAKLQYIDRIPPPPLVPPEGKDEHPLDRGNRIHTAAERYILDDIELISELKSFENDFTAAKAQYNARPDLFVVEHDWAVTEHWTRTGWDAPDTWGRFKLDLGILSEDQTHMDVIDYKTGKKYAPKHIQQGQLYAIVAFEFYPTLETINTAFWYVDQPTKNANTLESSYTRTKALILRDGFTERALAMTTADAFPPKTSSYTCRFCPYGEGRDGNAYCEYRYSFDN
jgi:RecB family exonuclease